MREPKKLVERSADMLIAGYYLSRCGRRDNGRPAGPPEALGVESWTAAYDFFYDAMGDGRTLSQFRNSLKNTRDTFDHLFDNGRVGWINQDGKQPSIRNNFARINEEWKDRSDSELESFLLRLQTGSVAVGTEENPFPRARTEGGLKVYLSRRRERDPRLRADAIAIHGLECMGCRFNFERAYGLIGKDFIEVHHAMPLSEAGTRETDPRTDLIVLCANCHRIVHRGRRVCLSLAELRGHLRKGLSTTSQT